MRTRSLSAALAALGFLFSGGRGTAAVAAPPAAGALPAPISLDAGWQLLDAARVAAPGDALSRAAYRPAGGGWHRAIVPGTVLTSLVADGTYPEPLYGENNRRIPESLCRTDYWYRTVFRVPAAYAGRHIWLRFDGINYAARVWVNGHEAGGIQGAFARGLFDVTPYVTAGRDAALAVRVSPPPHPGTLEEQTQANGVGRNGGILGKDSPTFVAAIGWDWMPGIRDRDTGIWQGVTLFATGPVVLQDPYVTTDLPLPRTDSADLTVRATLKNVASAPQTGVLVGRIDGTGAAFRLPITLGPGETKEVTLTPAMAPALRLAHPRLWWPNGYGAQDRYRLHLTFTQGKIASDAQDVTFGVRTINCFRPEGKDLTMIVNGVPVFGKGGNWGMDEAMKRSPRKRLDAQIRLHRDANYTMIRNWVGQATQEDFYDLCDQYGILVWDDFWLANPADGPNPDDPDLFLANAREKILRFRNHPSIALWCGRNEGNPPPTINAGLAALVHDLDGRRFYQPHSAGYNGVSGYGPYSYQPPAFYFRAPRPGDAFHSEIGLPSIPTLEAIHAMMPAKDWNTLNDDWAEHDLARGAQGGDRYPGVVADRYGPLHGLADFVRKSQMVNYECYRALYEGRNAHLFSPYTGVLIWMSNPAQPSFVWQLYSYDLEPDAALFGTKKACEPVHVQMDPTDGQVQVINNTPRPLAGVTVHAVAYALDGTRLDAHAQTLTAAPSAATDAFIVALPAPVRSPVEFVKLELRDARGALLSQNLYWQAQPDHPGDLTALNTLPTVALEARATRQDTGGACRMTVTLRNPAKTIALMAHLQLRRRRSGARVLPVFYSDNYISLLPGEERTVTIEAASADLGGDAPLIALDGWNVTVRDAGKAGSGSVPVVTNAAATVRAAAPASAPGLLYSINCGGGWAAAGFEGPAFAGDEKFASGGNASSQGGLVDMSAAGAAAAPESVYHSERWGDSTYILPVPAPPAGRSYTVRLHFTDLTYDRPGARRFHVEINGRRVLSDFDIVASAGGKGHVLVKDFPGIVPDASGNIVIAFRKGSADEPEIRAIQVLTGNEPPAAPLTAPAAAAAAPPATASWMLGPFVKADKENPVLTPRPSSRFDDPMRKESVAWEHDHAFNPAAVVRDGKVCLLYRAEDDSGEGIGHHTSRLGLALSDDGLHFTRRPEPVLYPADDAQKANEWPGGCEDPRIVETEDGGYVLTYTQWNRKVARLAVATSRDLIHWEKRGPAFAEAYGGRFRDLWCKSGSIVTRQSGDHLLAAKIGGKYWMYWGEGTVHAATSPDLIHWEPVLATDGGLLPLLKPRAGRFDSALAECGPPAVITDRGIVLLYNGKNAGGTNGDPALKAGVYSAGQALFDAADPLKLLARGEGYFLTPEKPYEVTGQYAAGTVFIEGLVHFRGGWWLYYGTADTDVAVAHTSVNP